MAKKARKGGHIMKGFPSRSLPKNSFVKVVDNSGAKEIKIIAVKGHVTTKKRMPAARVGDMVWGSITAGDVKIKGTVLNGVVVRAKKEYRRANGWHVQFESNGIILINADGTPKGTIIKGPVAREAIEFFPEIGKIAKSVV
ncbi:MAG: 50S ribosomal protein L14 [Candidatus Huberarchaeum crystalense]|uniref:Large ribosomal subunit protein uL14 n=1 Tax=Huberarchaeum crystalense TaxID=2014257 RepID=A0A2G9LJ13_HUBC1|nr:MAG: 50S ribosomal protein L14 [Candidatus Huberarchaeum crystalense]PIZ00048.1 MAG: 50S ribosomal protein L14 [Candidatus Huberarchaeum crystalense]PJC01124.1 MAG: 50S ribosomal protein L14 [Candidatus Huberarchaeum crystalense]